MFRGGNRFRGYKFSVADPSSGGCTENRRLKVDENQKRLPFFGFLCSGFHPDAFSLLFHPD